MNTTLMQTTNPNEINETGDNNSHNKHKPKNKVLSYFKFRLSEMRVLIAINLMLGVLLYPVYSIGIVFSARASESINSLGPFEIVIIMMPVVVLGLIFTAYVCGLNAFSHLHNKNICDMHLSLPLNHRGRFWANFFAGLSSTLVPYLLSALTGVLIIVIFIDNGDIKNLFPYGSVPEIKTVSDLIGEFFTPMILMGIVVITMLYVFTVFSNTISGNLFTASFVPILINGVIPLLILTLSTLALTNAWGLDNIGGFPYIVSSPLGFLVGSLVSSNPIPPVQSLTYMIPVVVIITLAVVLSFYLSKNIKAENIGRDFLYKSTYNIQQAVINLCITSIFGIFFMSLGSGVVIVGIVVSFVTYFVGHVVHYKGLHKLLSGQCKYVLTTAVSVGICIVLVLGKGFGVSSYIPRDTDITAIRLISYGVGFGDGDIEYEISTENKVIKGERNEFIKSREYTDEEWLDIVKEAKRIHTALIEREGIVNANDYYSDYYYPTFTVEIAYQLKNGNEVLRTYSYKDDEALKSLLNDGVITEKRKIKIPNTNFNNYEDLYDAVMSA